MNTKYFMKEGENIVPTHVKDEHDKDAQDFFNEVKQVKDDLLSSISERMVLICCQKDTFGTLIDDFKDKGFMVLTADSICEFFDLMDKAKPHNVVIDLNAPGAGVLRQNGSDATRLVMSNGSEIPEILETAKRVTYSELEKLKEITRSSLSS